jgi:hypothetical protein
MAYTTISIPKETGIQLDKIAKIFKVDKKKLVFDLIDALARIVESEQSDNADARLNYMIVYAEHSVKIVVAKMPFVKVRQEGEPYYV